LAQRGTSGRELVEEFACELEAGQALEAAAQAKRRLGYQDL
jgi:predicted DNA-binding WGR domain protein